MSRILQVQRVLGDLCPSFDLSYEMTAPDDVDYTSLMDAINTLLNAGNPDEATFSGRSAVWTEDENINMSLQASYAVIAALGMYMNYYGNVDNSGEKGNGTNYSSSCYLSYTDTVVIAALTAGQTSPCGGEEAMDIPT